jgi:formate dehydrogenase iron-sulfur subunit
VAAAGLLPLACPAALAAAEEAANGGRGVLVDLTKCIGCRSCENACRLKHGRPGLDTTRGGYAPGDGKLSFANKTFIDTLEATDAVGVDHRTTVKRQCMHCLDPACASVCPVKALQRTEYGAVVYDADRCIGCRYCVFACPFSVPRYEWDSGLAPKVGKCDFCQERQEKGEPPACVASCPTGALKFGDRSALLKEAHLRLAGAPTRYNSLYGEDTVGGTAWIYLGDAAPEALGFPAGLPGRALPTLTWQALQKVPVVIVVLGLFLAITYRRRTAAVPAASESGPPAEAPRG